MSNLIIIIFHYSNWWTWHILQILEILFLENCIFLWSLALKNLVFIFLLVMLIFYKIRNFCCLKIVKFIKDLFLMNFVFEENPKFSRSFYSFWWVLALQKNFKQLMNMILLWRIVIIQKIRMIWKKMIPFCYKKINNFPIWTLRYFLGLYHICMVGNY